MTGATVIANYELANTLVAAGVIDAGKTSIGINKGGIDCAARRRHQGPHGAGRAQLDRST